MEENKNCSACKFLLWYEDYLEYECSIKGCYNHSKFVEYGYLSKEEEKEYRKQLSKNSIKTGIKLKQ